jgi:dTDP-4-amino-4,6-dideoxygalactose transaminase
VVFADIDPETYLLDLNEVRKLLEASPRGTYSGIIPVDFAGRAVNLEKFRELADEFGLWMIEDSCHAPGGFFIDSNGKRQHCGNGQFAECAIFSFHPVKHIAAGEGGMITTNDREVYERLLRLRTHGITRDVNRFKNDLGLAYGSDSSSTEYPGWYMEMEELGYNYRLTDFQAALGRSQLNRAKWGMERRHAIARDYCEAFQEMSGIVDRNVDVDVSAGHAYHLYVIEVPYFRNELYGHLRARGIFAQIHYVPAHLMPYYRQQGWKAGDLPHAEDYYRSCISLPMFPTLGEGELKRVLDCVKVFLDQGN